MHLAITDPSELSICVHGTDRAAWEFIRATGLKKMGRRHIHMAIGEFEDENVTSGMRGSCTISVYVDVAKAMAAGIKFYRSENGVILSPGLGPEGCIPPACFKKVVDRSSKKTIWAPSGDLKPAVSVVLEAAALDAPLEPGYSLVDIGANLTKKDFAHDLGAVLSRGHAVGVATVIVTGTSMKESEKGLQMAREYRSQGVLSTAGIHPHDAKTFQGEKTILEMKKLLDDPLCVAVGECGLDYNRNFSTPDEQKKCFEAQVALAVELGKPIFVHEREAHEDLVAVLEKFKGKLPPVVIHCFTGVASEADTYMDLGFYIGLTGTVCMHERGKALREMLLKHIKLDRLMIETDAPFMHPCPKKDKSKGKGRPRCEPCHLPEVVNTIAGVLGLPPLDVAKVTTQNAQLFFGIPNESLALPKESKVSKKHAENASPSTSPGSPGASGLKKDRRKGGSRLQGKGGDREAAGSSAEAGGRRGAISPKLSPKSSPKRVKTDASKSGV